MCLGRFVASLWGGRFIAECVHACLEANKTWLSSWFTERVKGWNTCSPCVSTCLQTCSPAEGVSLYLNIHLSPAQIPRWVCFWSTSISNRERSETGKRKSLTLAAVTTRSVFFGLLIFHISPLIVSWWSLSWIQLQSGSVSSPLWL